MSPRTHHRRGILFGTITVLFTAVIALLPACEASVAPPDRQFGLGFPEPQARPEHNTMSIAVRGKVNFDGVAPAFGGYQRVPTGVGSGLHLQSEVQGRRLTIDIPGHLVRPGRIPLSVCSSFTDFQRVDSINWVGRKPSFWISFFPCARFGEYTSLPSADFEIDSLTVPPYPDFFGTGRVRGRLRAMATQIPSALTQPTPVASRDTILIAVDFWIDLENWPDGRANAVSGFGAFFGYNVSILGGSASEHYFSSQHTDPLLVISFAAAGLDLQDTVYVWLGTRLRSRGSATLLPLDSANMELPRKWPAHFLAMKVVGQHNDYTLQSLSGTITLDSLAEYRGPTWGEAKGYVTADMAVQGSPPRQNPLRIEFSFHVPVGFFVEWLQAPPPSVARSSTVSAVNVSSAFRDDRAHVLQQAGASEKRR